MEEKLVWVIFTLRTLEVYDNFDAALERYNQLAEKGLEVEIHKRLLRSEVGRFAVAD